MGGERSPHSGLLPQGGAENLSTSHLQGGELKGRVSLRTIRNCPANSETQHLTGTRMCIQTHSMMFPSKKGWGSGGSWGLELVSHMCNEVKT